MMAATPDPLEQAFTKATPQISKKKFFIAGIVVDVLGLEELPAGARQVHVLWLLNPRLSSKERMAPVGEAAIRKWNAEVQGQASNASVAGLIAVAFDQRNHGTRLLDDLANQAWRDGNPRHAQDMFSTFQGTAVDTSVLIGYLPAYVFPRAERHVVGNMVLGVSLGGHAAWHCVLHDRRITAAVVIIGCADYYRVMYDRAKKSKRRTWHSSSPPGSAFLGSEDFPQALVEVMDRYDPAALLMNVMVGRNGVDVEREPSKEELRRLRPLMMDHLAGKKILNLAGGADKLVPYAASEPFLRWVRNAAAPGGWFDGHGLELHDRVFEGVGHQMTQEMLDEATRFIVRYMGSRAAHVAKI